ncbi:MAG: glutamine-hydrolyzing carbamoyl-phosphate synthase small subunit [Alphaproteobacteria bacterium]|nr:glutamine-hydrolyzing carbamoyl-phosphate synthase small subunit [Alphaproteobacteria bacterium]
MPDAETITPLSRGGVMLADGTFFEGTGFGATGAAIGEVCFNTAMTGYQEILSDPSYAGQIVAFTFPHIGIVGTNAEDIETINPAVRGLIVRADAEHPSNYRSLAALDRWLKAHNIPAVAGIDTRALTSLIREKGMPHGVIANAGSGALDHAALLKQARSFSGLEGLDLAKEVSARQTYKWNETEWAWNKGYGVQAEPNWRATVIDYGVKRNILRLLASKGADITVVPANASLDDVMRNDPHGVLLSNGPGDPAATGAYAIPVIKGVVDRGIPTFGICLGHQMLALGLGAKTKKMAQGHHGANHPVKDLETGKVEIVSMNHGFTVDADTLPKGVKQTHISLFDGTNCGIAVEGKDVFSVQYHPEASPGPMDSHYLFDRFATAATKRA